MEGGYDLLIYVDDLEEALRLVRVQKLGSGLSEKIEFLKGDMVELEPLLQSEGDYEKLKEAVGDGLEDLMDGLEKGDEGASLKMVEGLQARIFELKRIFGIEKAKELINGNGFTLISTVDKKGKANTAFCGSATVVDDNHVVIGWMLLGRSMNNLRNNARATITGFRLSEGNPMDTEMVRVYCTLESEEMEGPVIDRMREVLEKEGGKGFAAMVKKVCLLKIEEIRVSIP